MIYKNMRQIKDIFFISKDNKYYTEAINEEPNTILYIKFNRPITVPIHIDMYNKISEFFF